MPPIVNNFLLLRLTSSMSVLNQLTLPKLSYIIGTAREFITVILIFKHNSVFVLIACNIRSLVWKCHEELRLLTGRNILTLRYMLTIIGNEKADLCAKNGSSTAYIGPEPPLGVPNYWY